MKLTHQDWIADTHPTAGNGAPIKRKGVMDTYRAETERGLTEAELDQVSGGEGYLANGAIRAVTQWFRDNTYRPDQYNYDCPR
jgi:hypothetical protein